MTYQPGDVVGKWTVLGPAERDRHNIERVRCVCACGVIKVVYAPAMAKGKSSSCIPCSKRKHGVTRHGNVPAEYNIWKNMVSRCHDESNRSFSNYGGRGIAVCARWRDVRNFIADMGTRPPGTSLDRVDNDGNYEPGNCRWATRIQQARNTRRIRMITALGETLCATEWGERIGITGGVVVSRLDRGWPVELAVSSPPSYRRNRVQEYEFANSYFAEVAR